MMTMTKIVIVIAVIVTIATSSSLEVLVRIFDLYSSCSRYLPECDVLAEGLSIASSTFPLEYGRINIEIEMLDRTHYQVFNF